MKKLFVSAAIISATFLASCGGSEICDCADLSVTMMNEMKDVTDMEKMTEVTEKYAADIAKCDEMTEKEMSVEAKEAMEAEMKECDSYKEMMKTMEEH